MTHPTSRTATISYEEPEARAGLLRARSAGRRPPEPRPTSPPRRGGGVWKLARWHAGPRRFRSPGPENPPRRRDSSDRKSSRLNASHSQISYAVFCLKKKKKQQQK